VGTVVGYSSQLAFTDLQICPMPSRNQDYQPSLRRSRVKAIHTSESSFNWDWSRHAAFEGPGFCWICLFPLANSHGHDHLRPSIDHVIPKSDNGLCHADNPRPAHRWCNSHRKSMQVTAELIMQRRNHMLQVHWKWLSEVARVSEERLVIKPRELEDLMHRYRLVLAPSS
jgi:hypothetical protein